jgi:hypothetical protein
MTKELEEVKATVADFLEWNAPRPDLLRATGKEGDAIDAEYWDAAHQAIRTLLSALSRGDGWEPIETAPKDGTVVLGWDRNSWFPDLMAWCKPNEWYDDGSHEGLEATDTPQWVHADWLLHREAGAIGPDDAIGLHGPEYWMPLPKDPPPHDFAADHAETILRAYAAPPVPEGEE